MWRKVLLTKEKNINKLKSMCVYCDRPSSNPCYLETNDNRQVQTCPLRPMKFREMNRDNKLNGTCQTCLSDSSGNNCQLSEDDFSTESEKNKYCTMRPLSNIFPIISSTQRNRIMRRISKWKAFFMQHGDNIIFMSGINAEGCAGGLNSGSKAIMDIVSPVGGMVCDDSIIEEGEEEDIGGVAVLKKRGRPKKEVYKQQAREMLIKEGLIPFSGEVVKRGRGRPKKVKEEDIGGSVVKKGRGRPRKTEEEKKPQKETKKTPVSVSTTKIVVGNTTSAALDKILGF